MKIRYEIEENTNAVKVFYDDNTIPITLSTTLSKWRSLE